MHCMTHACIIYRNFPEAQCRRLTQDPFLAKLSKAPHPVRPTSLTSRLGCTVLHGAPLSSSCHRLIHCRPPAAGATTPKTVLERPRSCSNQLVPPLQHLPSPPQPRLPPLYLETLQQPRTKRSQEQNPPPGLGSISEDDAATGSLPVLLLILF